MNKILLSIVALGSFLVADYSRDDNTNIITDSYSTLMWQDEADIKSDTWENAIRHCEVLELGGYDDWRLPNINELFSIVDKNPNIEYPKIDTVYFRYTESSKYWSSTNISTYSWVINFGNGDVGGNVKTYDGLYIRCVRGGK